MAVYRAMSILQGSSGDPKDRYVNTLHFSFPGQTAMDAGAVATMGLALNEFFSVVDAYVPDSITREDFRLYDLGDLEPREPTYVAPTTQPSGTGASLPFEVAACLSFYAERNIPRRRGRLFLGPLVQTVAGASGPNSDPSIPAAFRTAIVDAAIALQATVSAPAGDDQGWWAVYSPTTNLAWALTDVWMDDAFDTIRGRGTAATTRTTGVLAT